MQWTFRPNSSFLLQFLEISWCFVCRKLFVAYIIFEQQTISYTPTTISNLRIISFTSYLSSLSYRQKPFYKLSYFDFPKTSKITIKWAWANWAFWYSFRAKSNTRHLFIKGIKVTPKQVIQINNWNKIVGMVWMSNNLPRLKV